MKRNITRPLLAAIERVQRAKVSKGRKYRGRKSSRCQENWTSRNDRGVSMRSLIMIVY
uniref:Uncharacterized protein n=1 Tax=Glypta fumiferanae TaxID=389681 RepID=A0A0F6Q8D7_9HYME|nr:hypothetical protein [Glypta fumiferanae]